MRVHLRSGPPALFAFLPIALIIFLFACSEKKNEMTGNKTEKPIICAHRGASGHAPENTLAAMRMAMEMGAHMAELDVQQTADDRLAVFHDDKLNRTSTGSGFLWEKSLAELQEMDAGAWFDPHFRGEPIPTLEEVIALVRGKMRLNIEVKMHGHEREVAKLVVETIRRENFIEQCLVSSFDRQVVDQIKRLAPELKVGYIFSKKEYDERVFAGPVEVLSANERLIDQTFMQRAHAAGKEVHVWTVNDTAKMRKMIDLGVDCIITNYPDRLVSILSNSR